jgi:hypothetical protein
VRQFICCGGLDEAGGRFGHLLRRRLAAEELDESLVRQNEIGEGRVVDEVELVVAVLLAVVGPVGLRRRADLLVGSRQADHAGMHEIGELRHPLGRVALRDRPR